MTTPVPSLACVILAAGQGTRMRSDLPKVMHKVAGRTLVRSVVDVCESLGAKLIVPVLAPNMESVQAEVAPYAYVIQQVARGTGDAAKSARSKLEGFQGDVLILFGDTPLLTVESLKLLQAKKQQTGAVIVVAGFRPANPAQYGRLILNAADELEEIVEMSEATVEQKAVTLCNGGIMLFDSTKLWPLLDSLRDDNAKGEFFLTDCIKLAREQGWPCAVAEFPAGSADDLKGINTRVELAEAEVILQSRLRRKAMLSGVTMIAPETVTLSYDTVLGRDVSIEPNVVFGIGVTVGDKVQIKAFCHFEKAVIEKGAIIGPFARLRPGAVLREDSHIGNFVEVKNAIIGAGAKANHLTYIGDAEIGARSNIGAGTITCNYDGFTKSKTILGEGVFIGSNSSLVAPVTIGSGAFIGAGSVISSNVVPDALAVTRSKQISFPDWARKFREKNKKK